MKIKRYILSAVLLSFVLSCTDKFDLETDLNTLTIRADVPSFDIDVKANEGNAFQIGDGLYAYPYSLSGANSDKVGQSINGSINNTTGEYTFSMPEKTQDIIFVSKHYPIWGSSTSPEFQVRTYASINEYLDMNYNSIKDYDLVIGTLPKSEQYNPDTSAPLKLERKVARVSISMKAVDYATDSTIEDMSEYFDEISVTIPTYKCYSISISDSFAGSYSEQENVRWNRGIDGTYPLYSDSVIKFAENDFIFPSLNFETQNATITLKYTTLNGSSHEVTGTMSQPILPNKHYNLLLTLQQRNSEFDFEIEEFEDVEMDNVEIDYDDMVTFSVSPELTAEMITKDGISDIDIPFTLGEDDLYCYLFDYATDTLLKGYPRKQKTIIKGSYSEATGKYSYTYNFDAPKGSFKAQYSNIDYINGSSDYIASNTSAENQSSPLKYSDMRFEIKDKGVSEIPFIEAKIGNLTINEENTNHHISLGLKTTGFIFEIGWNEEIISDLSSKFKYLWLRVDNCFLKYSNEYGNFTNYISPRLEPESITVTPGSTFFQATPMIYSFFSHYGNGGSSMSFHIDIITPDDEKKTYYSSQHSSYLNEGSHNTIHITLL